MAALTACADSGAAGSAVALGPERLLTAHAGAFASVSSRDRFGLGSFPDPSSGAPGLASTGPASTGPRSSGQQSAGALSWKAPEHWNAEAPTAMRVANFSVGEGAQAAECYVTSLGGDGGGVLANLDRWRGQMGGQPLSSAELAELVRVTICGVEAPVLEMSGDFAGMGGATQSGSGLLGAVAPLADRALFVKLVGPAPTVAAEREAFLAFCESLTLESGHDHAGHAHGADDHSGHDHAESDHD